MLLQCTKKVVKLERALEKDTWLSNENLWVLACLAFSLHTLSQADTF